MEAMKMEH
jgi:biotin carboxyl carrier protein